jgi:branched-chain amino acid transport system substrate-binding protein
VKGSRFSESLRFRLGAVSLALVAGIGVAVAVPASAGVAGTSRGAATPAWAKVFAKYVGVKKLGPANPKLSPVVVGWVNAQGGIVQSPESTVSINAAVGAINLYLGGVGGGHPLRLKQCFVVQAESQGQKCAQSMGNDPNVKFVIEGVLPFGSTGFHQTNKGKKPVIGFNPITVSSAAAKNTYQVTSGLFGTTPGEVTYLADILHAKTASLLYPQDDPAGVTAAKLFEEAAAAAKIEVTSVGYSSTATDLLAQMTAAKAQSTDATVGLLVNPSTCQAGAKAAAQLNVKRVVGLALCLNPNVQAALGDYPKWTYVNTSESANLPKADPYVAAWLTAISPIGKKNPSLYAPFPQLSWGTAMTAAKLINQIGAAKLSPATFKAKMLTYQGPSMFGPPNLKWASVPGLPALGTTAVRLYTYLGNGNWEDATGGKWVGGS